MVTVSVIGHMAVAAVVWTSPGWLPRRRLPPPILVVDLVTLPPGSGILKRPSRTPKAPAPKKKSAPAPPAPQPKPKPEVAAKLPEPEAKPVQEPEPEAPPPEPEAKPEPVQKAEPQQPATEGTAPPAGVGGQDTAGLGGVEEGAIGALDDEAFEFAWYRQALTQSLRAAWQKPDLRNLETALRATVYFRVRRNGQIVNIQLARGSGLDMLDRSALRAVYDANPLPPLPYAYEGDSLGVHFYFELTSE